MFFLAVCSVVNVKALRKVTASVQNRGQYEHSLLYTAVWFWLLHVNKFWKCDNLLEFDEGSYYFCIFHPVGTLAFVVWCLYKIFWGVCLFCVSWILLQGSLKMLEGKGTEEDPKEQRWDHKLFIVLWTEWAIALVCVHYVTPLYGWLSKAVLTLIQLGTLCVLFIFNILYLINMNIMNIGLKWRKSVELMFLLHVLIWNLSSEIIAVHVSACF